MMGGISPNKAKPFSISKEKVWEAYKRVKANGGAAGIDEQSIEEFEKDLKNNLYKLWNRMSSGSYFPPAVKRVEIPKADGGKRKLGVPTVKDRIAQMVVKMYLEPGVETYFHEDSYGYRPGKSAVQAVGVARERCWRYDWVLDLDIKGFFDNIDHELMMKAVRKHTKTKWMIMYIGRWLKAPTRLKDGKTEERDKGTPQGGVISLLLANLFLHYAFDEWMQRKQPGIPFERYADDGVCHCKSEKQARWLKNEIEKRFKQCGLELNQKKTKIAYCKDSDREGRYENEKFDFLGYTFRARRSKNRQGKHFINFSPAVSNGALKNMRKIMKKWKLHRKSDKSILDLAIMFNPMLRGWINYYGRYYKSALYPTLRHFDLILARWATLKYKKLRRHRRRGTHWINGIIERDPKLFAHWKYWSTRTG